MKTIDEYITSIEDTSKALEVIPTGFEHLDSFLNGGFMKKELIIIGGFTGFGKSYIAGQIALNVARKGFNVGYFSLEISGEMIVSRFIGSICNVHPTQIVMNKINKEDEEKVDNAKMDVAMYSELIHIHDDLYDINELSKAIANGKFDFVVVDFIQNIVAHGEEYERMSSVALTLQRLAKVHNCCILTLSQLSNSAAKSGVTEYKGSGGIAMVADMGFFMTRGEGNKVILEIKKNRRGFSGTTFALEFEKPGGRIYEK